MCDLKFYFIVLCYIKSVKNIFNQTKNSQEKISAKNINKKIKEYQKFIEKNFEYVGEDFSKKVREIYYDKKNKKAIYGTTTPEERKELAEEGIDLLSIPWINKDN